MAFDSLFNKLLPETYILNASSKINVRTFTLTDRDQNSTLTATFRLTAMTQIIKFNRQDGN